MLWCLFVNSQQEASNWYFGDKAGIRFNLDTNIVSSDTNGQLETREGCASISDANGGLLFYTDGTTVYNSEHQVMEGGEGLLGDASSTQSALIVPKPNDSEIYYIFTVGSNLNPTGLNYSIVDTRQNGELGEVVTSNVSLLINCAEKISAVVKDCITGSIWIITLSNPNGRSVDELNTFHAFEVSENGVDDNAITSNFDIDIEDTRGYLKFSPDGAKLGCANVQSGLYLFDFDSQTGKVSNDQRIPIFHPINNKPYGLEFSPDSQLMYVSASNDFSGVGSENPANHRSDLLQFKLNAGNVSNTQIVLDSRNLFRGGLQLGPDGKIYRALSESYQSGLPFLGVIENPNEPGLAANYIHNAINLGVNTSSQGLPPFVQSFFTEKIDIIRNGSSSTSLTLCAGETYILTADDLPGANYTWRFNGNPLSENDFDLEVTESGDYEVSIGFDLDECSSIRGQAFVNFATIPFAFNGTLIQCEDDIVDGLSSFNLNDSFDNIVRGDQDVFLQFYTSLEDAINYENSIGSNFRNTTNPQTVYVEVINNGFKVNVGDDVLISHDCSTIVELNLIVNNEQTSMLQFTSCDELDSEDGKNTFSLIDFTPQVLASLPGGLDLTVSYYRNYDDAFLQRFPLQDTYTNSAPYSQIIYYRVENTGNCYGINEIQLSVDKLPNLETAASSFYCLNSFPIPITLDSGIIDNSPSDLTYNWSTGENTYEIEVNEIGNYTVRATNANGCSKERTITVEPSNIATIESVQVVDASQNNVIIVQVSGQGEYDYALQNEDGIFISYQSSNSFENIPAGIYTINVRDLKNDCGVTQNLVSVIGFPKYFTPNNDGIHDTWQIAGVSSEFQPNSNILIYDRYGKLLKQLNPSSKGWDGTFNGKVLPNDDYWFAVKLQDGRIFKNHFSLKR